MTRAAIYCRISSDPTGLAAGAERQESDCRAFCAAAGWDVAELYVDNDLSAWSGKARPAYRRMLADVAAGGLDAIVSWHVDRLYRVIPELSELIEVCNKANLTHIKTLSGDLDLTTADGRLHAHIMGSVAQHESDHKAERLRRKMLDKAQRGDPWPGGRRGYGYDSTGRHVVEAEAAVIRECAERVIAGESLRGICADLNRRAVPTAAGGQWKPVTLRRLLKAPRIAGLRTHNGQVVAEGNWPAIIDHAAHELLTAIFTSNASVVRGRPHSYLLTGGLAKCGLCGTALYAGTYSRGARVYRCVTDHGGCGRVSINADRLEALVTAYVLDDYAAERHTQAAEAPAPNAELVGKLAGYRKGLAQLTTDYYAGGAVDGPTYARIRADLANRIEAAERELAEAVAVGPARAVSVSADALASTWPTLDIDDRRALVRGVLASVVIQPNPAQGRRFRPERVTIVSKDLAAAGISADDLKGVIKPLTHS